jgi:DnaJ-domain-containing protein 1
MTTLGIIIVIGCCVAGFWSVSFVIDAFRSRPEASNRSSNPNDGSRSSHEREPLWFEVLGVLSTASIDEIKSAYRERARQYHPDRLEGLGDELRQLAERKMKQLNAAYDYALRSRR